MSLPDYVPAFEKSTMCQGSSECPAHRYLSPLLNRWPDVQLLCTTGRGVEALDSANGVVLFIYLR